ncbi:pyrroloquinoline quinone-dependent dehydrogenase [Pollutibacter soli]|uniref:pyrroloquinoline quinone-dependent dehydrogenase n=1 Tax=Pollutibacter soli TaxID=3034157 RepID=UPI003013ADEA
MFPYFRFFKLISICFLYIFFSGCRQSNKEADTDWKEYNGDLSRSHYSALKQIDSSNLPKLKLAWTYHSVGNDSALKGTQMQCNPIIIDGILYGVSADIQLFALSAATGVQIWKTNIQGNEGTLSRGVTYHSAKEGGQLFWGAGSYLYCIDAKSGELVKSFGANGRIDLRTGLYRTNAGNYLRSNTPNVIYKNLIIVGMRVAEEDDAILGDIRAFDIETGKLVWTFHTIPDSLEFGRDSWQTADPRVSTGGANSWAGMALDAERGIIFAPTGSATYDFYGGDRKGDNLFANCLLALDASTGKRLWHFQFVHHDLWDRDPPSPPNLLAVTHNGRKVDAVAQVTKQGYVYIFDRVTGEPLFPIEERKVRTDGIDGEYYSLTQPFPLKPLPFNRQAFLEKDVNEWSADAVEIKKILAASRTGEAFIPVTSQRTIFFPGTDGGAQWGGAAVSPDGIMFIPSKQIPCYTTLESVSNRLEISSGGTLYATVCASCHGKDQKGNADGSIPSLINVSKKYSATEIDKIIVTGLGMMPSITSLNADERKTITEFLSGKPEDDHIIQSERKSVSPYKHTGYNRWFDSSGYPVSNPPWGLLTAIDMNSGDHLWEVPLGEYPELIKKGIPPTGTDNYGGPLITASGLIFIAATKDEKFRAFDQRTGKLLWQTKLPAAGFASPSTYSVNGKQYIVIACGGGKLKQRSGDQYVAFSLDE